MGYTNRTAKIKWWDPHTNKLIFFHFQNLMNIKINLEKDGHPVLN